MRDLDGMSHELRHECVQRVLNRLRDRLVGGELRLERDIAEAAGEDPPVPRLLPVIEAVASVVRAVEHHA